MLAGLSALGVKVGYGVGTTAAAATYNVLHRINAIGGISASSETIDASALEDLKERSVAGRESSGGSFDITLNLTPETLTEWEAVFEAYEGLGEGEKLFVQIDIPGMTKGYFVSVQTPKSIAFPDVSQNTLLTVAIPLTIEDAVGWATKVTMTDSEATP